MADQTPVGLTCPGCGEPPVMIFDDGRQCFCGSDDCPFLMWDSTKTMAELNADARTVDLTGNTGETQREEQQ